MEGEITVKAPMALLFVVVLVASLMVNVWKFAQPSGIVVVGGGGQYSPAVATQPNGQGDVLRYVPKNSRDAVGPGAQ